jgi:cold shock CspA family protein
MNGDEKVYTGTCKHWVQDRGFGFIKRNDNGPDVFCHFPR